jgi:hypothetical protein
VDNSDKLLAFKMELARKDLKKMEEENQKVIEKAGRSIMVIFVIVAEFVILSWIAKTGYGPAIIEYFK